MKTEFSRHELYAMGEPFGTGATRVKPGGRGRIYGGGGGDGVKYENLDKLYEMQAAQGQQMMDFANKNVYPAFESMMDESKGVGSIANQELAATQAGADVQGAIGQGRKQLSEDLASMGVNPSDPRYAQTMARMELDGAAQGAAAQTGARDRTKQLGYARTKDAISLGMGIPSDAVSALNSAGQMASSSANMQAQGAATRAQSQGNIAALAGRMLFADGGEVKSPNRLAVGGMAKKSCYTDGGEVKRPQMLYNGGLASKPMAGLIPRFQAPAPPPSAPTQSRGAALGNAAVGVGGVKGGAMIEGAGNLVGSAQTSAFGQGLRLGQDAKGAVDAYQGAANTLGAQAAADTAAAAQASNAATAAYSAAPGVAEGVITEAGAATAGEALGASIAAEGTAAATAGAAAEAGGVAAALGAGSAVAAALPWVGGAMLIGSALGLFADGGSVNKKRLSVANGINGGPVSGPGGPKDDLVPAMLSDGEFVMPVGTVQLYGKEALEKMRQDGLAHEKQIGIGRTA